jgi:predicted amidohydrolase
MSQVITVAAIQAYPQTFDLENRRNGANVPHALELLDKAASLGANIACFHELYPMVGEAELCRKARDLGIYVVAGLEERAEKGWYNTATLISPKGKVVGRQRKNFPTQLEINNGVLSGDGYQVFETEVGRLGMVICSDFAFFTKGVQQLVAQKVDIIFNPALWFALSEAFPPTVIGRHMEYSVPVIGVNIAREPLQGALATRQSWQFPPAGGYTTVCVPPKVKVLDDLGEWFRTKPGGIDSMQGFVQILGTQEGIATAQIDIEAVRAFPGYFYHESSR